MCCLGKLHTYCPVPEPDYRTIWHRGQFGTGQFGIRTIWHQDNLAPNNLAPRTIWHCGQFGTADNLAPRTIWHRTIWHRTIWHRGQFGTADNLAPRTIWHQDNLAPRTIWHRGQFGTRTIWHRTIWHHHQKRTIWHRGQFGTTDNLAPYPKNYRTLYIGIGYILPTIGRYMSVGGCLCALRAQEVGM